MTANKTFMRDLPWGGVDYDHKTPLEVIKDFVEVRGDIRTQYAQEQLADWIARFAKNEADKREVLVVNAALTTLETSDAPVVSNEDGLYTAYYWQHDYKKARWFESLEEAINFLRKGRNAGTMSPWSILTPDHGEVFVPFYAPSMGQNPNLWKQVTGKDGLD